MNTSVIAKPTNAGKPLAGLYACVHTPEFAAQALLRIRHALRARPVAVLEGHAPLERVYAANLAARREGVVDGMTRVEAESFVGLTLLRRNLHAEEEGRAVLLGCAGKYTPAVEEVSTVCGAAVCVLDLAGTEKLFGPPMEVAERLLRELAGFGIYASIALSANFHAAVARARSGAGVMWIEPGEEQKALAPLLLSVLPISAEQMETLAMWGIRTLGGMGTLPERQLIARMGQAGKRLRALARGEQSHLFTPGQPGFVLRESYEFDAPVPLLDSLLFVLSPIIDQLLLRAGERALALASLTLQLQLEGGGAHTRAVRPALPTTDRKLLLKLVQLDLDAHPPAAAVVSLAVTAEPGPESRVQLGLFSPQLPESTRLDVTLARLRALVGDGHVGSPQLRDTHAADKFVVQGFSAQRAACKSTVGVGAPSLRRVRPPAPLSVRLSGDVPGGFIYGEREYSVVKAFGPWRESGDWWSAAVWSREQWDLVGTVQPAGRIDAAETSGALYVRVARDLLQRSWVLEAIYD